MILLTCKHACERATDYIEGPTSLWRQFLLLTHLVICRHCRRFYRQLRIAIGATPLVFPNTTPSEAEISDLVAELLRR